MKGICCQQIKRHPDYRAFSELMHGGVFYSLRQLREILKTERFKRFTALFPSSVRSGVQGPDSSDKGQPGNESRDQPLPAEPTPRSQ